MAAFLPKEYFLPPPLENSWIHHWLSFWSLIYNHGKKVAHFVSCRRKFDPFQPNEMLIWVLQNQIPCNIVDGLGNGYKKVNPSAFNWIMPCPIFCFYLLEKWLFNRDYHPGNRSKQFQETHTITAAKFEWKTASMHGFTHNKVQQVFNIRSLLRLLCEFLGTVWTYYRGDNPRCIITSGELLAWG